MTLRQQRHEAESPAEAFVNRGSRVRKLMLSGLAVVCTALGLSGAATSAQSSPSGSWSVRSDTSPASETRDPIVGVWQVEGTLFPSKLWEPSKEGEGEVVVNQAPNTKEKEFVGVVTERIKFAPEMCPREPGQQIWELVRAGSEYFGSHAGLFVSCRSTTTLPVSWELRAQKLILHVTYPAAVRYEIHFRRAPTLGVGIVPFLNAGDQTEVMLHEIVGELPEVDRVFDVDDSLHLFQTLEKIRRSGKRIAYLVIAGHGSRDTPGIKFAKDDMIPEEVDLQWNRQQLAIAQRLRADPKAGKQKTAELDQKINELKARIAFLTNAAHVMAKDAVVLLINCAAAATPKGRKFVQDFGQVLLGLRGGHIVASRTDIVLNKPSSLLQRFWTLALEGDWPQAGEIRVKANWMIFPIPARV